MLTWPAKDPDEVLDYRWTPILDAGDTIASIVLDKVSGDVATDSDVADETGITLALSGGTDGDNLFRGVVTTTGGRTFEEYISLAISSQPATGLVAKLRLRYGAFDNVSDARIQYWITDAGRIMTEDWGTDYEPGLLALAAHSMTINRVPGITLDASEQLPAGVTRFKSASMDVAVSDAAANRSVSGGYSSTSYGLEFAVMLRRNRGMPRLVGYVEPRGICWS